MYKQYYNLESKPFSLLPDPKYLYLSSKHSLAYAMLEYGLTEETGGYAVITGDIGAGKTTLLRKLINEIDSDVTIGFVSTTSEDFDELLALILSAFKLEFRSKSKIEKYQDLVQFIESQYKGNKRCVLVIDEAQNISLETLEELRMLTNVNTEDGQKLQLVLSGQPGLLDKLKSPKLSQLAQRVSVQYNIDSLSKEDCIEYVAHRLSVSGNDTKIFDDAASIMIWYYSRGIPRVINSICDLAMVYGYAEQKQKISANIIKSVIQDRKNGGLFSDMSDVNKVEELLVSEI